MKIQGLKIYNFLGIQELELTPDGKFQFIQGRNGSGKTSILEAISYAFEGRKKGMKIKEYINKDAEDSQIFIDLGDMQIMRQLEDGKETVRANRADGSEITNPKKFLKSIMQGISFAPIEFAFSPREDQKDLLLRALKIKYEYQDVVDENILPKSGDLTGYTGVNLLAVLEDNLMEDIRLAKKSKETTEAYIAALEKDLPAKEDIVSMDDIRALDTEIQSMNTLSQTITSGITTNEQRISVIQNTEIADLQKEIRFIEAFDLELITEDKDLVVTAFNKNVTARSTKINTLSAEVTNLQATIASERERIASGQLKITEKNNERNVLLNKFEKQKSIEELPKKQNELAATEADLKESEEKLEHLRKEVKPRLVNSSDLKVEGLTFENRDFYVNGVILYNLSDAEKLRIAVKIAQSISGDVQFILLDGIEMVDPESMKEFLEELKNTDFQYFFTTCQPVVENDGQTVNL